MRQVIFNHPELEIGGVVVNLFQSRARLPQQLVDELQAEGLPLLEPFITTSVKMRESHQSHRPLVHLAPRHKLSQQFEALYESLETRHLAAAYPIGRWKPAPSWITLGQPNQFEGSGNGAGGLTTGEPE